MTTKSPELHGILQKRRATFKRSVSKETTDGKRKRFKDTLVAEEPFTVVWESSDGVSERLASTMRTPADDLALAAGMLFSEGVIRKKGELHLLSFCAGGGVNELNKLKAELRLDSEEVGRRLSHRPSNTMPQSACGMCGLDNLNSPERLLEWASQRYQGKPVSPTEDMISAALEALDTDCKLFSHTGASHACVILDSASEVLALGEDVGRHNACDKAVGQLILEQAVPHEPFQLPDESGVLFSSRLSFELASKAVAAGAAWIASVGAPTHLAVELAEKCRLPLLGFVSRTRINRY